MTDDRISYNTPETWTGGDWALDSVDEIVLHGCTVHMEMLNDDSAYFHLSRDGRDVRGHLTAVPLTPAQRREQAERHGERLRDVPKAALLITVEDDELGIGEEP